ncbi:phage tail sheath family protein [Variovorax saccharolyticus]|uniref:phage tail sheath family protein n=1 Tax=Variovorax saccharolyticus TaxID=3053516 RepID=UPI00257541C3|nr:phage tail sheath C-terminal domain-containing protein [Variovorax sp. J31P216]MDM0030053.1 phage tail sheath subtilisin-like domain-containing protein [Variovorax sp. J31P216]
MPSYLTPGVYIEELPSGSRPIEGVATSTACFVGYTERGPMTVPTLIGSWDDYERSYGTLRRATTPVTGAAAPMGDPMGHAVSTFFLNGGSKAYVVRLATGAVAATADINNGNVLLTGTANNEGSWGTGLVLRLTERTEDGATVFDARVGRILDAGLPTQRFDLLEALGSVVPEAGQANTMGPAIGAASKLVRVSVPAGREAALRAHLEGAATFTDVALAGGSNGTAPGSTQFQDAFAALSRVRDVNILLLPGQSWSATTGRPLLEQAIAHCEGTRNRMLIVDVPPGQELDDENEVNALDLPTSTYAASYYPWPLVANPYYSNDVNPSTGAGPAEPRTVLVSPAAMAAGLWAKTDARRGVWKAPAGIEFPLLGVNALEFTVDNTEQDFLNPAGVNALRRMPGFGPVVWGTRTRSTRANPEWRYVPVRRTAIFIEESVYGGIQWAVFEPNDHRLWSSLRANIESFMNGLFRAGAFQGEKATDAYFVKCGLGQTMTQDDIDRGHVIVLIGFAPLKPAEFVIVRIQQKVGQQ